MRPHLCMLVAFILVAGSAASAQEAGNQVSFQTTLDKLDPKGSRNQPHKLFTLRLLKGQTYIIDMISAQFDTYLRLETSNQTAIAEDDDGGGGLNSRIRYAPPTDDDYRIVCTTFNGAVGDFVLRVTQEGASKDIPVPKKIIPKKVLPKKIAPPK